MQNTFLIILMNCIVICSCWATNYLFDNLGNRDILFHDYFSMEFNSHEKPDTISSNTSVDIYYQRIDIKNWGCNDCEAFTYRKMIRGKGKYSVPVFKCHLEDSNVYERYISYVDSIKAGMPFPNQVKYYGATDFVVVLSSRNRVDTLDIQYNKLDKSFVYIVNNSTTDFSGLYGVRDDSVEQLTELILKKEDPVWRHINDTPNQWLDD